LLVCLVCLPVIALAAETEINTTTIIRLEERSIGGFKDQTLVPATQFLGADLNRLGDGNLSLHFYGWGRADLGDKSFNDNTLNGSLTYGYLQYRFGAANADTRLGRIFVRDGIVNEQVDGIGARTDLPLGFGISAFGGATVHTAHLFGENSDGKGNAISGGRLNYRYRGMFELGLSGVYESSAPALTTRPNGNHRLVSGDIWLSPFAMVDLMGHTSYNTETSQVSEHSYLLTLKPLKPLTITGTFDDQHDRSYLYAWSMFSAAALNPADRSRSIGSSVAYQVAKNLLLEADYKHYRREAGSADRYGGEARFSFLDNVVRSGIGYHYLRADSAFAIAGNPSASYHTLRGWVMEDTATFFSALDLIGYFFKEKIYNENKALEAVVSLGYHLTPNLALSGDLSYGRNPDFNREVKGLIRLTYNLLVSDKGEKR
jgi:hypothetical protein